ncbi:MAG TPA: hypothetical protein VFT74_10590, partial [Isosphaeraceae bacterium]|nr:hypothetical protein [Isosphaeraceae bacterium]
MSTGDRARRISRATPARGRLGGLLRRVPLLLALGAACIHVCGNALADDPEGGSVVGEVTSDLPPLPTRLVPEPARVVPPRIRGAVRRDEPPDTIRRLLEAAQGGEPESEPEGVPAPDVPGITRFRDLRGLGGAFYQNYGPRTLSRALGLQPTSPIQIYGWIQNSFTGNPSQPANGSNFGVNPNDLANRWMGNQYYLVLEDKV